MIPAGSALGCERSPGARLSGLRTLPICKTLSDFLGTSGGPPWGDAATCSSEWKLCWPSASPACGGKALGSAPDACRIPVPLSRGSCCLSGYPPAACSPSPPAQPYRCRASHPALGAAGREEKGRWGNVGHPLGAHPPCRAVPSPPLLASVSVAAPLEPCEEGM